MIFMKKRPKFLYINIPSEELKSPSALKGRSGLEETVLYERIDDERLQDLPEDYEIKEIDTHRFPEWYFTYDLDFVHFSPTSR